MYKIFIKIFLVFLISNLLFFYSHITTNTQASVVFSDDFNRLDSTSLGPNWLLFYGGQPAGIENNQAYIEVGAGGYWGFYKVTNLNIQDQDVKITFTHQNGDTTLLARVIDVNNRIAINYYQTGSLQIYEVNNGNYRLIPNTAPNAIVGNTYTVRVRIVDNSIKVWVNEIQYADATLNHVTSGSAGFGANDGYTKVFFDNFSVEDTTIIIPSPEPSSEPTLIPSPLPTSTPTPIPTFGPFELPFGYEGRPAIDSAKFVNEFWEKATSLFDHSFVIGLFTPFTGNTINSTNTPCSIPLNCYDTHNGTDFDDLNTDGFAYSVSDGVVLYKSDMNTCATATTGYGCMVLVRYPGNIYGLYAHLQGINVSEGQTVTQTTKIGTIGNTGNSSGTHLHFGVLKPVNDKLVSPTILSMKRKDWHGLLQEISATSKNRLKAYCTYRSPNGISFEFIDPSGWRGITKDPWSLPKNKDGCGVNSRYLWKFQI